MKISDVITGFVSYLINGQTNQDGWGNEPGISKETNPLNTAEVLIGLMWVRHHLSSSALGLKCDATIRSGIGYLLGTQLSSGGWATGSAYRTTDHLSKGNIVSTTWAVWALCEWVMRFPLLQEEKLAIRNALHDAQRYLIIQDNHLWSYHPDTTETSPMASAYALHALALLQQIQTELGSWDEDNALQVLIYNGLNQFESEYLINNDLQATTQAMERVACIQACITIQILLKCHNLQSSKSRLNQILTELSNAIGSLPSTTLTACIIEKQAVVEPGKLRDFIHYVPVWVIVASTMGQYILFGHHLAAQIAIVVKNIDPKYEGASHGGSKRHTWSTALTLMAIESLVSNFDLLSLPIFNKGSNLMAVVDPRRVFVVHGRNEAARRAMFEFLRSLGLHPVEWDEAIQMTGKGAPYVGEVLDVAFSHAQAMVIVMTGDDEARLRPQYREEAEPAYESKLTPQARANVIFEAGMALGRNPERTIIVQIGTSRPFSDILGRHVVRFAGSAEDRQRLAVRLETAGCQIQRNGTDWLSAGDFNSALARHVSEAIPTR